MEMNFLIQVGVKNIIFMTIMKKIINANGKVLKYDQYVVALSSENHTVNIEYLIQKLSAYVSMDVDEFKGRFKGLTVSELLRKSFEYYESDEYDDN